jgi:hypothetical protein
MPALAVLLDASLDAPASFDFAKELTTQVITLSTAVIGVSTTFAKDLSRVDTWTRRQLHASWICFLLAVVLGLLTLGALTGILGTSAHVSANGVYSSNVVFLSQCQFLFFLAGVALLIIHAIRSAR